LSVAWLGCGCLVVRWPADAGNVGLVPGSAEEISLDVSARRDGRCRRSVCDG